MKIKSDYLNRAIEIPLTEFMQGDEKVSIIPHEILEDIIYNSEECAGKNVQVHYTPIVSEPGHYAFLCAISDNGGRRIECVGESTEATLVTEISKQYPALMAVKRAFDDAAIKFLRFPKSYSDQQIDPSDMATAAKPSTPKTAPSEEKKTEAPEPVKDEKPAEPVKEPEQEDVLTPDTMPTDTAPVEEDIIPDESAAEPPAAEEPAEAPAVEAPAAAATQDEFDTTIITCGSMKKKKLSVRQLYNEHPTSVRWIAWQMSSMNEANKLQKEVCQRFLDMIGDTEGR